MVRKEKIQLILVPLLLLALVSGCKNDKRLQGLMKGAPLSTLMSGKNIDVIFSDSGKVQARITGPLVNRYTGQSPYIEFPKGFKVMTYDSALQIETTITGNYGKRDEVTHVMEAKGNVIVRNVMKNERLETEVLLWDERKHLISCNVPVKIVTPDKILYGDGLESNESFTNYRILKPRGQMMVNRDSI